MERRKNEHQRQAFFNLFNDVSHAKDDLARAAALNKVRKIHDDAVDVSIIMSLAHAHAISKREKYLQTETPAAKREMQVASAVAAYIGLDNNKVCNPYRNNKITDGQTFVLDGVKSMYNAANDEKKALLDRHYEELYGKTCPELIEQISVPPAERHHLIPIDAKKIRTASVGAAVLGSVAFGVAASPANAAEIDISLHSVPYSADSLHAIPASFTTEVFNTIPTATSGEITLNPVAPPESDTQGDNSGEMELNPVAPPDNGTQNDDSGEMELNPVAPPDSGNNNDNGGEMELDPVAPPDATPPQEQPPETTQPSQPPASEKPEPSQPPATEKPVPPKPDRKPHTDPEPKKDKPSESESQKEKEAKAYKVYTDYVRANVASLKGSSRWHPMDADKIIKLIDKYYEKYKDENGGVIDREFIAAVLWQESKYDPTASSGVAFGLGQFTEPTRQTVAAHIKFTDIRDPDQSVHATFWYYNNIYSKYDSYSKTHNWSKDKNTVEHKLELVLAGYNSGPGRSEFKNGDIPPESKIDRAQVDDYIAHIIPDYKKMKKEQAKILGTNGHHNNDKSDDDKHEKKQEVITGYSYYAKGEQKLHYWNQGFDNGSAPYAGGTFKNYGCAPSSLATIVSTLTDNNISNVRVGQILDKYGAMVNGSGTNREVFKNPNFGAWDELGIEVKRIDLTDAAFKKVIDNGGMILMRQQGGVFASSNGKNYAHFMAVTGYNNHENAYDNVDHKFYIADSNSNTGARYTKNKDGFSFSTIKGSSRARTGNLTNAYAVYVKGGKDAPKSDVSQKHKAQKKTVSVKSQPKKQEVRTETISRNKPKVEKPKEISLNPITHDTTPNEFSLNPVAPPETHEPKVVDEPKVNDTPSNEPSESAPTTPETTPETPTTTPEAPQTTEPDQPDTIELAPVPTEEPAPVKAETPVPHTEQVNTSTPETPTTTPETVAPVSNTDTPQPLTDGQTIMLRNKFNANHVVTDVPTLTKQQMRNASRASR